MTNRKYLTPDALLVRMTIAHSLRSWASPAFAAF